MRDGEEWEGAKEGTSEETGRWEEVKGEEDGKK